MSTRTKKTKAANKSVPIAMPIELDAKIEEAMTRLPMLSKQDVMRLSIERGLSILVNQLTSLPVEAGG